MADPRYDQIPDVQRLAGAVEPGEPGVLVRSEERLNVSTQRFTTGRARLEKYLITETRTITVEVTREEVRLVHDDTSPTAPADPARPTDLGSPAADEIPPTADPDRATWLVLQEERVVITKEWVPVEKVRLDVFAVAEDREVTEQVRREQIELEDDSATTHLTTP